MEPFDVLIGLGIVRQFRLSKGDKLRWSIRAEDNHLIMVVEPIRASGRSK